MNLHRHVEIKRTKYNREACKIGIIHLGFGAFHRAHQAVYIDNYMEETGDLNWGIAAVNLRAEEANAFSHHVFDENGYLLKTTSPNGEIAYQEIRSHICFEDWATNPTSAENLVALPSVKIISMTVTESGYYLNDDWSLNDNHPIILDELKGGKKRSIYAYLAAGLKQRMKTLGKPITILCCDNIRSNGEKLCRNFKTYLVLLGETGLLDWIDKNATFPNSMVDRITPRATEELSKEVSLLASGFEDTAIHAEGFIQWVLQDKFVNGFPALEKAGVEIVDNVDPYEEAKIRILNGGHTGLCYLGALAGYQTFDQAMTDPKLREHFDQFEEENVLPGLTVDLPFNKAEYCGLIAERFSNTAIADDLSRICMDGWSKFPIYIRPTIKSCLAQGIQPGYGYDCIASWYVYARRFAAGKTHIPYHEPYWEQLKPLLQQGCESNFASLEALWSDLPKTYDEFVPEIVSAIKRMEQKWPI